LKADVDAKESVFVLKHRHSLRWDDYDYKQQRQHLWVSLDRSINFNRSVVWQLKHYGKIFRFKMNETMGDRTFLLVYIDLVKLYCQIKTKYDSIKDYDPKRQINTRVR
jgi:hypothetical protein